MFVILGVVSLMWALSGAAIWVAGWLFMSYQWLKDPKTNALPTRGLVTGKNAVVFLCFFVLWPAMFAEYLAVRFSPPVMGERKYWVATYRGLARATAATFAEMRKNVDGLFGANHPRRYRYWPTHPRRFNRESTDGLGPISIAQMRESILGDFTPRKRWWSRTSQKQRVERLKEAIATTEIPAYVTAPLRHYTGTPVLGAIVAMPEPPEVLTPAQPERFVDSQPVAVPA